MLDALQWFVDLGSIVVLPILIFIFGVILGTKPGKALTSASDGRCWICRVELGNRSIG